MSRLIALHGRRSSLILEPVPGGAPLWRHWGARLEAADLPPLDTRPLSFSPDVVVHRSTAPGFGLGEFGQSILLAHRQGRGFTCAWTECEIEEDERQIIIRLRDTVAGIALEQRLALDADTDLLTCSTSLANEGDGELTVDWLAAALLPLPASSTTIRSFTGRHNAEFVEVREPMPAHGWQREERRGLTGHGGPAGLFVMTEGAGWHAGEVHAVQLAWSGNSRLSVERESGTWTLSAGEWLAPGEIRLAAGERLATPELLATFSPAGLNGASANFHAAVRKRMDWPGGTMRPRPVHLNSWESLYFDQDEATLMALASRAARVGVERFILDDGWFRGRDDDRAGLGDWQVDTRKYPRGLGPLATHVIDQSMEFGLWVEPEMINPDSDLYRTHPDWALAIDGRASVTARNQLVLDMARPEVRDHLFEAINALLATLPISYLKWDHNRHLAPAGGGDGRASYHRQVEGTYMLIDRLRAAHPAVEMESCAGGGGRIDAGIATRTHRFWASDNLDAVSRVGIQRGFLAFMPPELMGAHVGASPAHATGRTQSLALRAAVALPGHFGVELDPATLDSDDSATLAAAIARYKDMRDTLHHGTTWLGEGPDGLVWQAVGRPEKLILFVIRTAPPGNHPVPPLRLPMCADSGPLTVSLVEIAGGKADPLPPWLERSRQTAQVIDGAVLARVGLPLPSLRAETVAIFTIGSSHA